MNMFFNSVNCEVLSSIAKGKIRQEWMLNIRRFCCRAADGSNSSVDGEGDGRYGRCGKHKSNNVSLLKMDSSVLFRHYALQEK